LGAQTQIPSTYAKENASVNKTLEMVQSLDPADLKKVKNILCTP